MQNLLQRILRSAPTILKLFRPKDSLIMNPTMSATEATQPTVAENVNKNSCRNKPLVVICGCTGTGKTKLSIQLAEWLIGNGKQAEVINADAMQMFAGLPIITNKATGEEMKGVKHHLIGHLESTNITHHVIEYKNQAVSLIDQLMSENKVPILVGGTHYYIYSVLFNALIEQTDDDDDETTTTPKKKHSFSELDDSDSEVAKFIIQVLESGDDLNVRLHDSPLLTEDIYEQLKRVDMSSACRIHPNDRRKSTRALQIYYTHGLTKSAMLELQRKVNEENRTPLRYKNVCLFSLGCETETLNARLDQRVDQMIANGLLDELVEFKKLFDTQFPNQTFKSYSRNFEFGIFQSIGFKEFDEYLQLPITSDNDTTSVASKQASLFDQGVNSMKMSTRRYAKTQIKWIKNRFMRSGVRVHNLDTSCLQKWTESVFEVAKNVLHDDLESFEKHGQFVQESNETNKQEDIYEFNKCDVCDKTFINKDQWNDHLAGSRHKKRVASLKNKQMHFEKLKSQQSQ